jgi:hypothetical protein
MVYKPGYKTITSQIYSHDDPMLDTDAQFGVTGPLIASYARHEGEPAPDPDVNEPWYTLDYTFVVEPGEAWLPTPPVTAKAEARMTDSALSIPNIRLITYQFRLNRQMVHLTMRQRVTRARARWLRPEWHAG